jgi:hypothetical protein
MAEPLRFCQIRLAAPEFILRVVALGAFCAQGLIYSLEILDGTIQLIARVPKRLVGASLRSTKQRNQKV